MAKKEHSFQEICSQLGVHMDTSLKATVCPFCAIAGTNPKNEKKFGVDENKRVFNCFKCNRSGTYFGFVLQYLKEAGRLDCKAGEDDITATKRWFGEAFGSSDYTPPATTESPDIATTTAQDGKQYTPQYTKLSNILPAVGNYNYLRTVLGLKQKVLDDNNIREAKTAGNFNLLNYFSREEALKIGLATITKDGNFFYLFKNCEYVMPLYDGDKIESMQGRTAGKKGNYWFLKNIKPPTFYIPKQPESDFYYICEGILTSLAFISDGKPAMCITSKGYKIDEVLRKLKPYKNKHFILSPDIDGVKRNAMGERDSNGKTGVETMKELRSQLKENCYNVDNELHRVKKEAEAMGEWSDEFHQKHGYKDYGDILKYRMFKLKETIRDIKKGNS